MGQGVVTAAGSGHADFASWVLADGDVRFTAGGNGLSAVVRDRGAGFAGGGGAPAERQRCAVVSRGRN